MKIAFMYKIRNIGRRLAGSLPSLLLFSAGSGLTLAAIHLLLVSPHRLLSAGIAACGTLMLVLAVGIWSLPAMWGRLMGRLDPITNWLSINRAQVVLILTGLLLALASRAAAGDRPQVHSPLAAPLWVVGIVLTLLGCRQARPESAQKGAVGLERGVWVFELFVVALLFVGSLALRAMLAGRAPYVLSGDEGSAGLYGWEFVQGKRDNLLGLAWFSFPALYFWLLSISQSIFGRGVEAIRWVSALGGALTVAAVYGVARSMWSRRAAIWGALWLATFHHHIFFSRVAYNNIWDGFFFILAAWALWIGVQQSRRSAFLLAGLAIGLSQYFYTTSRLGLLILLLWTLHLSLRRSTAASPLPGLTCTALTAASAAMPLVLLYAAHPDMLLFTSSRVSMLVPGWLAEAAAALGTTPVGLILEQAWVTFLGLSVAELQGVYYGSGVPLLFGLSALLVWAGLALALARIRDPRGSLQWLTLAGTVIVGGLSIQAPNAQRMLLLPPVFALAVAFALEFTFGTALHLLPKGRHLFTLLLTGALLGSMLQNLHFFYLDYLPRERYGSLNGEVAQAMIDLLKEEPGQPRVYFLGGDRMAFDSIPSLPYLLPQVEGETLTAASDLPAAIDQHTNAWIVIVLPEQAQALEQIKERFSSGKPIPIYNRYRRLLFYFTRVERPR
jgi:4-amino-4-deoxy-L-arabinose transferase-like glycosyltransferase